MNPNHAHPSAEELRELGQYLQTRRQGAPAARGEPASPSGLAGELLELAENTQPDAAYAARLELQLRQAAVAGSNASLPGWLPALWQSFNNPERKTTMKRLAVYALIGIILFAIVWVSVPALFSSPAQTQLVLATPASSTPVPTPFSPLTPTAVPPTAQAPVAINFTPKPIPAQPPVLPSLADALGAGFGGSGAGNLPEGLPVSLAAELPESPGEVTAYYRLENTPLTLAEAQQIATQWGLEAGYYMPAWMQSLSPDQTEHSYHAIDGMQDLGVWNGELSYIDLSIYSIYGGHQYPETSLPPSDQAVTTATQFLVERGYLDYPYQVDLDGYAYGLVSFHRLVEGTPINTPASSVKITAQGAVGYAWVSREEYQSVGSYPIRSAEDAWSLLASGEPGDQLSISYHPAQDGNPQFWGRVYLTGQAADLFGAPSLLLPAEEGASPHIQLDNLVLVGDVSGLLEYLETGGGYIHAWGNVQEVEGARQLELAGWEPFDEFSGYFNGTVRRTDQGGFLELEDGTLLSLPDLPADISADMPVFAEGGRVGDSLEWFILQVHPADEGALPPDLSQAEAIIDKVDLVYLAPGLSSYPPDMGFEPSNRMLIPAWSFSGHIEGAGEAELTYQAYVQAVPNH